MLVLARKRDQDILIGDNIRIRVVDLHDGRVWLGIDAPKDIRVDRSEIRDRIEAGIMRENRPSRLDQRPAFEYPPNPAPAPPKPACQGSCGCRVESSHRESSQRESSLRESSPRLHRTPEPPRAEPWSPYGRPIGDGVD